MSRCPEQPPVGGIGVFRLGKRLRNLRWRWQRLGDVYRARHAVTRTPALVLVPDAARETPLVPLTVRLTSCPTPAHLALEVESGPAQSSREAREELLIMVADMRDTLEAALQQPGTLEDLLTPGAQNVPLQPARGVPAPVRHWSRWARVALAGGLALLLWPSETTPPASVEQLVDVAATNDCTALADAQWSNEPKPMAIRKRLVMPDGPLEGQDQPPCGKGYVAIRGGCWAKLDAKAPNCPERSVEHQGGCYLPVKGASPVPMSIDRRHP